jgi:hypothetical protein
MTLVHNLFAAIESITQAEAHCADSVDQEAPSLNQERESNQESNGDSNRESDQESDAGTHGRKALLKSQGRSLEVTGLGVVTSLAVAFGSLVGDGTMQLSQYLVFLSFMMISAAGMVWRIWRLRPQAIPAERLQAGVYRVSFRGR